MSAKRSMRRAASSVTLALAAPADPDPGFSGDGEVRIESGGTESARALALQPDGKILVAGDTSYGADAVVYRLNPDGSLDSTFDADGKLAIQSDVGERAHALAVQPDGRILVAGTTQVAGDVIVYRLRGDRLRRLPPRYKGCSGLHAGTPGPPAGSGAATATDR